MPRSALASLSLGRRDPLAILHEQNATRVRELVPLRAERMAASPFAFYRGTAAIMAADLAQTPHSGILVAACGDAHIDNFGFYASPQRSLVFDLNDFDEAAWAPWEWDLKRLVTSIVVAGRDASRPDAVIRDTAMATVTRYAEAIRAAIAHSPVDRYFTHFDIAVTSTRLDRASRAALEAAADDARRRTRERAADRLLVADPDGRLRFSEKPPTMTRLAPEIELRLHEFFER